MGRMHGNDQLFLPIGGRLSDLTTAIGAAGLGAVLLSSPENVYYTSGYTATASAGNPILYGLRHRLPPFVIVTAEGEVVLGCWGFSVEGVDVAVDRVVPFNSRATALEALEREALVVCGGRPLGIEDSCSHVVAERLRAAGVELAGGGEVVIGTRLVKSAGETGRLARSLEIAESALLDLLDGLQIGASRVELMRRSKRLLLEKGADGAGHVTFSFGHTNPEIAIDETLAAGDLVVLDLGAIVDGYHSDTRRYAHAGPVPPDVGGLHSAMVEIVDSVGAALLPGSRYREIYDVALDAYRQRGVAPLARMTHVGHHIGLETEEHWIDQSPETIAPGMVIAIELYTLTPSGQQIGNEETYVVEPDGPRRISVLPREIRSVRA